MTTNVGFKGFTIVALIAIVFLKSTLSFSQVPPEQIKKDFDFICKTQKRFSAKLKKPGADPAALAAEKVKLIQDKLKTSEAKDVVHSLNVIDPKEKVATIEKAADELGLHNWHCPEIANW